MYNPSRLLASTSVLAMSMMCFSAFAQDAKSPFDKTVRVADYLEPAIPMPTQEKAAKDRLATLKEKTGRAPNILIILVDDMGWGDIGVNGGGAAVGAPTPNIDKLAHEGLHLTSTYSQPTSTPSRAALMTGRLPARTGLTRPLLTGENPKVNPWDGEDTTAKLLSNAGYRTAIAGKWHLGEAAKTRPHEVGYDEYLGILSVTSELSQGGRSEYLSRPA